MFHFVIASCPHYNVYGSANVSDEDMTMGRCREKDMTIVKCRVKDMMMVRCRVEVEDIENIFHSVSGSLIFPGRCNFNYLMCINKQHFNTTVWKNTV